MKRRILSLFAACIVFSLAGAQEKIYVSLSGNDTNDGTESKPLATLEAAASLVKENTPTTIYLQANVTFNITKVDFKENKNIEIIGDNTTLKAANKPGSAGGEGARILRASTGCDVKLKGLNFVNGRQIAYLLGGGLYFNGNTMEVEDCKFINNESGSAGAGIGSRGKRLIVKNCYFEGNYTIGGGSRGAAIMHCGPNAAVSEDNYLKVINCTFYQNKMVAGGQGTAIGIYDPSIDGGEYMSSLDKVEIINCTFMENDENPTPYQGVIDTNNSDANVYLINNTFYNETGALRVGFTLGEIVLVNNVVYAQKAALFSDTRDRTMKAYHNIFIGKEAGVNENMTDACLHADKEKYHNVVEMASNYPLDRLGLATALSTGAKVPYLEIIRESSALVGAGLDDSSPFTGSNMVPSSDIRGSQTISKKDIGAYESPFVETAIFNPEQNGENLFEITKANEAWTVKNTSGKTMNLRIFDLDGRQLQAADFTGEYVIDNRQYKGLYILRVSDGTHTQSCKIIF